MVDKANVQRMGEVIKRVIYVLSGIIAILLMSFARISSASAATGYSLTGPGYYQFFSEAAPGWTNGSSSTVHRAPLAINAVNGIHYFAPHYYAGSLKQNDVIAFDIIAINGGIEIINELNGFDVIDWEIVGNTTDRTQYRIYLVNTNPGTTSLSPAVDMQFRSTAKTGYYGLLSVTGYRVVANAYHTTDILNTLEDIRNMTNDTNIRLDGVNTKLSDVIEVLKNKSNADVVASINKSAEQAHKDSEENTQAIKDGNEQQQQHWQQEEDKASESLDNELDTSELDQSTTNLLGLFTGFWSAVQDATATNCKVSLNFPGFTKFGTIDLDFCSIGYSWPPVLNWIVALLVCLPASVFWYKKIISIIIGGLLT